MNLNLLIPPTASPRPQSRGASRAYGAGAALSRASMGPGYMPNTTQPNGDPLNNIFKDRFSYINTAKTTIEKQREFEATLARLQRDFAVIDRNGDGLVSLEELQHFLSSKVGALGRNPFLIGEGWPVR